jgi:catechol 2,3-dioxygenase-like lactoylglutathione lyase family enzyme
MADVAVTGRLRRMNDEAIHPAVRVGHAHLRVADLDRAIGFYRDGLGFGLTADARAVGLDAAFLAAGELPPPRRPQHLGERRRHRSPAGAHWPLRRSARQLPAHRIAL